MGLIMGLIAVSIFQSIWGAYAGVLTAFFLSTAYGVTRNELVETTKPGQRLSLTIRNAFLALLILELSIGLPIGLWFGHDLGALVGLVAGLSLPLFFFIFILDYGVVSAVKHYCLRLLLAINNRLPFRLIPFLDYCVDLIFLRQVGGGYIFVHRLLMEHFAAMYSEREK
jgi:hypothetical protein